MLRRPLSSLPPPAWLSDRYLISSIRTFSWCVWEPEDYRAMSPYHDALIAEAKRRNLQWKDTP